MAKDDLKDKGKGKKLALERRDLGSMVQRELAERYPQLSFVDTDVRVQLVDGKKVTMRDHLTMHKCEALANKKRLSSMFWSNFTAKWVSVTSPEAALVVANPAEVVEPPLLTALANARSPNTKVKSNSALLAWLGSSPFASTLFC